ncbi:RdgB/HAM1 family non-canonical purine NTP pyrophosphatase [Candidatus Pelagibacter sp.]|nr:RdgB/HAM1 family non-canonical purine NTP pyrophosphatase [Candidatus Pelagibacter sp.]MDC0915799.1 RdgB/HAM1 family non-canonical purine NTP pyrophosphatase [Candidatus Pelagibacter sp.]MDC0924955.1 RdgB/HAM1 family non-canonical purine NTP pyrophosphatase [Candidatus Pelagibacter sp.]
MKKISKLLIGTNNKGKYKEITDLLPKYIKTHSTSEFKLKSPKENGLTFTENSIIKSKHFSKKTKLICLADDSGLEIDILDKSPGIYSARWGGKKGNFKKAIIRVYKELSKKDKDWKNKKVKARFICSLSICYLDKKIASVLGKVEGYISAKPKGKNGFGYDPIFIPKDKRKTFGEMSSLQKYKIDHRFAAFKKIRKFL